MFINSSKSLQKVSLIMFLSNYSQYCTFIRIKSNKTKQNNSNTFKNTTTRRLIAFIKIDVLNDQFLAMKKIIAIFVLKEHFI